MIQLLQHPVYGIALLTLLGLCVGSFLNVVILRFPRMLKQQWHQQCEELLSQDQPTKTNKPTEKESSFNLNFPASHCPQCKNPLKLWHNIPLLSYVFLAGRCAWCKQPIPWRYPFVELVTALGTGYLAYKFGISWQLLGSLLLFWSLICLTGIDFDHQLLPDDITIPLVWAGLIANYFEVFTNLESAVIGAVAGYLGFWLIFQVHYRLTGRQGLGYGDFKLLGALGAWLGWQSLPLIILLASVAGTLVTLCMMGLGKIEGRAPISFGPYLALAGLVALLWGNQLTNSYVQILGF